MNYKAMQKTQVSMKLASFKNGKLNQKELLSLSPEELNCLQEELKVYLSLVSEAISQVH